MSTTVAAKAKPFFTSKLFLLGAVQFAIGLLDLIQTNVLQSETAAWGAVGSGVFTMVLRLITKQPVHLGTSDQAKLVEAAQPGATIK